MLTQQPDIETGSFAASRWLVWPQSSIKVMSWNINRGLQLPRIIEFLTRSQADILLLQEADLNARRTHHLNIAREIARKLELNYVFGCEFQELTQGTRNSPAYHGQATLSRWPLSNARILRFQQQSDFWRPHWFLPEVAPFQERLGGRLALVTHVSVGDKTIVTYNLHLESRGDDRLRRTQLQETFQDAQRYSTSTPVVVAGDLNMDVSLGEGAQALRRADFLDAFANQHTPTTPNSLLADGRVIDWILLRGSERSKAPQVHSSVKASDHYPLSVTLDLR